MNTTTSGTTVVQDAVEILNKQNREVALAESVRLINSIREKKERIEACHTRIAEHRLGMAKIAKNVIDETTVFGGSLPENANRQTIVEVIAKANKDRQAVVENQSSRVRDAIVSEQDQVAMLEKAIAELVDLLVKVKVAEVTVQQITG